MTSNDFRWEHGKKVLLSGLDPNDTNAHHERDEIEPNMARLKERLEALQNMLYAEKSGLFCSSFKAWIAVEKMVS